MTSKETYQVEYDGAKFSICTTISIKIIYDLFDLPGEPIRISNTKPADFILSWAMETWLTNAFVLGTSKSSQ